MLLDKNGNNLAGQVEFESFNRQLSAVNRHTGSKLVNAVQQDVHAILQQGEAQVAKAAQALIDAARSEADDKLTAELSRLEALKAVNPNIRDDELAAIESNRQQVMDALAQAGWRLDALRLNRRHPPVTEREYGDGKLQSAAGSLAGYPVSG
jgi:ATP-dependent helicase HepA